MWQEPTTWGWIFLASEWIIRLTMLVFVPLRRSPAAAKGWLLLVFFEPWAGLILYWLIGRTTLPRWRTDRIRRLRDVLDPVVKRLQEHPNVFHPKLAPELAQAVTLAENLGHMPIIGGNAAELLSHYDGVIARLAADIDGARHHVHLLYYIFADDLTTAPVIAALGRAVQRGVYCRVLIDALGSRSYRGKLLPTLTAAGVEVHEVLPYGLLRWQSARMDLRNHRKIAIIDGQIGYTGSQNLVTAKYAEGLTYEELVVRVCGPVVLQLQYVFVADWFVETDAVLDDPDIFPAPALPGDLAAQVLPSGPSFTVENTQRLLVALIHGARQRVVITTPYFVPDEPLLQAMQTAVLRGVEVRLVMSEKEDQLLVSLAQKSYYEELLEAGVQIHLYRRNFLHAKHASIDDEIVLIGSSNMDIRSFSLNAEVSLLFYEARVAAQLRAEQERYFANCKCLTLASWEERSFAAQVAESLARLLSPLL